jgi:hypothetical protein
MGWGSLSGFYHAHRRSNDGKSTVFSRKTVKMAKIDPKMVGKWAEN